MIITKTNFNAISYFFIVTVTMKNENLPNQESTGSNLLRVNSDLYRHTTNI